MYDTLYVQFLYYFNAERDFFECHEVMEELWLEEGRSPLYQGLLQVAVGLYHHENGNRSGAIKLFRAGIEKLQPYAAGGAGPPLGIDLQRLVDDAEYYVSKLEGEDGETFSFAPFSIGVTDERLQQEIRSVKK